MRTLLALVLASGVAHAAPDFVYVMPTPTGQGLPSGYYTDPKWPKLPSGDAPTSPEAIRILEQQAERNARYNAMTDAERAADDAKLREALRTITPPAR